MTMSYTPRWRLRYTIGVGLKPRFNEKRSPNSPAPPPAPHSLEEVSETLNGHTLKLRCLEGLWRQAGSNNNTGKDVTEGAKSGDHSGNNRNSGTGASGASLDPPAIAKEEGRPFASTAPALRAGFSGLLKRLGSNPLSSGQKEVRR